MIAYLTLATFLMAFCMIAKRLSNTILTAPMVFLGFGVLLAQVGLVPKEGSEAALHLAVNTVWISAILHGITAAPGARWYAKRIRQLGERAEMMPVMPSADTFEMRNS